jgi:hypothetical protein
MSIRTISYAHLLEVDEKEKVLNIYRVYPDGKKELFTSADFPGSSLEDDRQGFKEFALRLGENILVDSPAARNLLKI